ncbi:MAG TPA: sugar phosphate isomerase/epimerase family protein [Candidatus Paceibacterota bacterium]|nr:sugar phosphate isomerase/epimerase family protein [Candidatus Paceibacterota bacterium]HSA01533.1 sugar phosphate isomerase/epimerase family protein [Candidatus Paceibacterota bacterium]
MNRRTFLAQATTAVAGIPWLNSLNAAQNSTSATPAIRIGACVVNLDQAKKAGLDGVEVGVGGAADRLSIADPAVRQKYREQMSQTGLSICSLMMGLLNEYPLASDPRGPAWLEQSIDAARDLGARVILVAFFGNGDLLDGNGKLKDAAVDVVVQRLKAAAPRARDAGVILAIENYLNAEQNARILDRINHESVQMYYDVFNTGATKGYDVPAELRFLKERVVQIHFKNGPNYLENGQVKFEPIVAAIKEIQYRGWIVLETSAPSKDPVADVKRNADYARRLLG